MCARFVLAAAEREISEAYGAKSQYEYFRNWNIAPTDLSLVITADEPSMVQSMKFGVIPWFSKTGKLDLSTINSRDDRLLEPKSIWRPLTVNHKSCLVLTSGFYEWERMYNENGKLIQSIPYFFSLKHRRLFAYAGLWSRWVNPETKEPTNTFSIVTTVSNDLVGEIHEKKRMPVILRKEHEHVWLSRNVRAEELVSLCQPLPDELMTRHRVSSRINAVSRKNKENNDEELIMPLNSA